MSWDTLNPLVERIGHSFLGSWLGESTARIAWLLTLHLFGLTLLLGSAFLAGLHLLGVVQADKPIDEMAREIRPVMTIGLLLMLVTGSLIFTGGAIEYYKGSWFRTKMILLAMALVYHFTVYRVVTRARPGRFGSAVNKLAGLTTLLLWFSVGVAGRFIAFF